MIKDKRFYIRSSTGEDFGVHISFPKGSKIRNSNGEDVLGVNLSIEEARRFARAIRTQVKRLEVSPDAKKKALESQSYPLSVVWPLPPD